jgi:hypothetical protein
MSHERLADAGAAASLGLWLTSLALEWIPVLQALSLIVAIVAGILAGAYHLKRLMQ